MNGYFLILNILQILQILLLADLVNPANLENLVNPAPDCSCKQNLRYAILKYPISST